MCGVLNVTDSSCTMLPDGLAWLPQKCLHQSLTSSLGFRLTSLVEPLSQAQCVPFPRGHPEPVTALLASASLFKNDLEDLGSSQL